MPSVDDATRLRSLVDAYRLEVNGIRFWAPYWVNDPKLMGDAGAAGVRGAFKGKGTPGQLALSLRRTLADSSEHPRSAEDYRLMMRVHGLGVDCSGFVYQVLSGWLRAARRRPLPQQLVVSRDDIITAMQDRSSWQRRGVAESEVRSWPRWIPLQQVCQRFHKDPRMLTAVATLVHPEVVTPVTRAKDIRPGDLIKFTSKRWGDHIALVVEQKGSELIIAESTEPADQLGGVGYSRVAITDPERGLQGQGWARGTSFHPGGPSRDGVWRLKEVSR